MIGVILSQMMSGLNIVCAKYLVHTVPIAVYMQLRFGIASLVLIFYNLIKPKKPNEVGCHKQLNGQDWAILVLQALCAGAFFSMLLIMGLHYTSANIAGIITSALPICIAVLGCVVLGSRLTQGNWLAIFTATGGLLLIRLSDVLYGNTHHAWLGDFLILLALLPEASYFILSKKFKSKLPTAHNAMWMNIINSFTLMPFAAYSLTQHLNLHMHRTDWGVMVLAGLSSAFFYIFWLMGSKKVNHGTAALCTTAMPIFTLIFAWLAFGEVLKPLQWLGMVCVVLSILLNVAGAKIIQQLTQFFRLRKPNF